MNLNLVKKPRFSLSLSRCCFFFCSSSDLNSKYVNVNKMMHFTVQTSAKTNRIIVASFARDFLNLDSLILPQLYAMYFEFVCVSVWEFSWNLNSRKILWYERWGWWWWWWCLFRANNTHFYEGKSKIDEKDCNAKRERKAFNQIFEFNFWFPLTYPAKTGNECLFTFFGVVENFNPEIFPSLSSHRRRENV